jgi:hypothetical protein
MPNTGHHVKISTRPFNEYFEFSIMPWPAMLFCEKLSVMFTAEMTTAGLTYILPSLIYAGRKAH